MLQRLSHFLVVTVQQCEAQIYPIALVVKEYIKIKTLPVFICAFIMD